MSDRKIALVGHSGCGKSSAYRELLNRGYCGAEMDPALGIEKSPSFDEAMEWMISYKANFLVVSVHERMLDEIAHVKEKGEKKELLKKLSFVYLSTSKEKLEERLMKQTAETRKRPDNHIQAVLNYYFKMDTLFRRVADYIIDTTDKDNAQVVEEILRISFPQEKTKVSDIETKT